MSEPNKDNSSLVNITLDHSVETHCLTIQCFTCNHVEVVKCPNKTYTIIVPQCLHCGLHEPQSDETTDFIADRSFGDVVSQYNPLSVTASNDLRARKNTIKSWLMEGNLFGKSFLSEYVNIPIAVDHHINLLEDVVILMYSMLRSRNLTDRYLAIVAFCKMRGSRPGFTTMLLYVASDIFGQTVRANVKATKEMDKIYADLHTHVIKEVDKEESYELQDEEYDNIFAQLRSYTSMYDRIKETALYKKVYKFGLYILASGLLSHTKINFQSMGYSKFEQAAIERTHKPGVNMVHCMVDTVLFVCDRGTQYFKTGDADVLFSSGGNQDKWMSRAQRLIRESQFLGNPEPHGINRFKFTSEIKDTIERGIAISKYSAGLERTEIHLIKKTLNELQLIQANQLTKKDAQAPRKEPFSLMIHGPSSIAKTQLVRILFTHYGKCFNLPIDSEFMYTRCALDPFWSGQTSSQWCVVMDDVAFLKPNGQMDPTLGETIMIGNETPFCPPQAELSDKGRTPLKCDLILGTTNTLHLNLHDYFSCPFAVARRFKLYITAHVKPEFSRYKVMVDSALVPPTADGEYMNIWNFTVSIAIPASDSHRDGQKAKYKVIKEFSDIYDMLQFVTQAAKEHEIAQTKSMTAKNTMAEVEICKCYRPKSKCNCSLSPTPDAPQCNGVAVLEERSTIPEFPDSAEGSHSPQALEEVLGGTWYESLQNFDRNQPIIPIDAEPIEPEPQCKVTWLRYWLLSRIIAQETIEYDFEYTLWAIISMYSTFSYPLFFAVLYGYPRYIFYVFVMYCIFKLHKYMWIISSWYYQYQYGDMWKYRLGYKLLGKESSAYIFVFRLAKRRMQRAFTPKNLTMLVSVLVALKTSQSLWNYFSTRSSGGGSQSATHAPQADVASFEGGEPPVPHEVEKAVFYYHDPYVFTDVDISNQSKNCQPGVLENKLRRSTARFQFKWIGNEGKCNTTSALNVRGHIWMFNAHVIKGHGSGSLNIILDPITQNVSRNVFGISVQSCDILHVGADLAFMSIRALPPGPNIHEYFAKKDRIPGRFNGEYHLISNDGTRSTLPVSDLRKGVCPFFNTPAYVGSVAIPTKNGDCGSPCVMHAGANRKIILGIHATGNGAKGVSIIPVSQKLLQEALVYFDPQVDSGTIVLDAPGYPREIGPVHQKSALRFIPQGTAHVIGSFKGFRPQHKSRVKSTFIKDLVEADGYKADYGPPDMTWKPWNLGLTDMTQPSFNVQSADIKVCQEAFLQDIVFSLLPELAELKPYDLNTALNGVDGVTYVDRINIRTSAGNPFKKSKLNFLTLNEDNKIIAIDDVVADRIRQIEDAYKKGRRAHPQFCEHLKDDPMPLKKRISGATRLFSGGEFAWSVVVRKYLLPHIRLIQNNPYIFEAMPGVVAQSEEWQQLYNELSVHSLDRIVAGDYGKFDKKMLAEFVLSAFDFLIGMSKLAQWSEDDIMVLRCIAEDTAFAMIDFNGDLIEVQGNPSGHPLTVIINCIVNCLYMRYAFMKVTGKSPAEFKRYVKLVTYGDDNLMSVSAECPQFNHTSVSSALAEIGVKYTMADKEAESLPYINISEASFLKRKFIYDDDVGAYVGPLEHASIEKMLTSYVDNGQIAPEAHSICVIETALREYFFYGKKVYEERKNYFKDLVQRAGLEVWVTSSTFPDYEQLVSDFWMRTGNREMSRKYAPSIEI